MVTTRRNGAAQPQTSSRPSLPCQTPKRPDAEPIVPERTHYDVLELLRAYLGATAMLEGLVHAARNPEVFEQLRVAFSQRPPSD